MERSPLEACARAVRAHLVIGLGFTAPGAFLVGTFGSPLRAGSGFFLTPLRGCLFRWQAARVV